MTGESYEKIYDDYNSPLENLLEKDHACSIYHQNICPLLVAGLTPKKILKHV